MKTIMILSLLSPKINYSNTIKPLRKSKIVINSFLEKQTNFEIYTLWIYKLDLKYELSI